MFFSMFFDCKITLSIKEPGTQFCPVPQCPDPPRRRHRQLKRRHLAYEGPVAEQQKQEENHYILAGEIHGSSNKNNENGDCVSGKGLLVMLPLNVALLVAAVLLTRDGFKQFTAQ